MNNQLIRRSSQIVTHISGEVGTFCIVLLSVFPGHVRRFFFTKIDSYLTDTEQKISWHDVFADTVHMSIERYQRSVSFCSHCEIVMLKISTQIFSCLGNLSSCCANSLLWIYLIICTGLRDDLM